MLEYIQDVERYAFKLHTAVCSVSNIPDFNILFETPKNSSREPFSNNIEQVLIPRYPPPQKYFLGCNGI